MNVIDLNAERQRRQKEKQMITIPIIKRIYEEDGEIKFEISGEREVPVAWLDK
ncbi:hypothetical protein [Bacillus sp. OTU530]|uniref:hypothetical protein n=1 Tax=Bacillus sp. OTU530 TaxID=3043862 RepID=UPI00313D2DAA